MSSVFQLFNSYYSVQTWSNFCFQKTFMQRIVRPVDFIFKHLDLKSLLWHNCWCIDDDKLFLFHCRKEMMEESMMHSFGHHQAHHHQHLHHQHHQQQMCNNGQMMVPHDYGGDLAMSAKMLDARLTDDVRVNLSFVKNEPLPPSYLRSPFDHSHHRFPHTIPPVWERLWRHLALLYVTSPSV